jgi:hypothetical protein
MIIAIKSKIPLHKVFYCKFSKFSMDQNLNQSPDKFLLNAALCKTNCVIQIKNLKMGEKRYFFFSNLVCLFVVIEFTFDQT